MNFLIYEEYLIFFFVSVATGQWQVATRRTWDIWIEGVGVQGVEPAEECRPLCRMGGEGPTPHQAVQKGLVLVQNLHVMLGLLEMK
jgi:hypothetical protein